MNKFYTKDEKFNLNIKQTQSYIKITLLGIFITCLIIFFITKMKFNKYILYMILNIILSLLFIFYIFYEKDFKIKLYKNKINLINQIINSKITEQTIKVLKKNSPITLNKILFDDYSVIKDNAIIRIYVESNLLDLEELKSYQVLLTSKKIVVGINHE